MPVLFVILIPAASSDLIVPDKLDDIDSPRLPGRANHDGGTDQNTKTILDDIAEGEETVNNISNQDSNESNCATPQTVTSPMIDKSISPNTQEKNAALCESNVNNACDNVNDDALNSIDYRDGTENVEIESKSDNRTNSAKEPTKEKEKMPPTIVVDSIDGTVNNDDTGNKKENKISESNDDDLEDTDMISLFENLSWEMVTKHVLDKLHIENYSWMPCENSKMIQVQFVEADDQKAELILIRLIKIGIGKIEGSAISMIPASIHMQDEKDPKQTSEEKTQSENKEKKISEFRKSIKSRLTVAQVVEGVRANAKLTFDFVMLIILASAIAAMGLVENNSVVLVASMLISPLMGPILAGTFGAVVRNASLRNLGLKNEVIGLAMCLGVGFLFGIITGAFGTNGAIWGAASDYPTKEMKNRGVLRSLWTGLLIAVPSGAGVALSVLGGNAGSLVGVAISASLLPPAVNSGMLWAYSMITLIHPPTLDPNGFIEEKNSTSGIFECPKLLDNTYNYVYSCNMATEACILGLVSLFLTLLNIVCIVLMAIVVLKVKEVAPNVTSVELTKDFWKRDIKIARDSYKTLHGTDSMELAKRFREEWNALNKDDSKDEMLSDILSDIRNDDTYCGVIGSIPSSPYRQLYDRQFSDNAGIHDWGYDTTRYNTIHHLPAHVTHHPGDTFQLRPRRRIHMLQNRQVSCSVLPSASSSGGDGKHDTVSSHDSPTPKRSSVLDFFRKPKFVVRKVDETKTDDSEGDDEPSRFSSLFHKRGDPKKKKFIVTQVDEKEVEKQQMLV